MNNGVLFGACLALPLAVLLFPLWGASPGARPPNRRRSRRFNRLQPNSRLSTCSQRPMPFRANRPVVHVAERGLAGGSLPAVIT